MKNKHIFFILIQVFLIPFIFANRQDNYIVINTKTYQLNLFDNEDKCIDSFLIGIGKNGIYKTTEGDNKTPIGEYKILWKASVFYEEDGGYPISEDFGFYKSENLYSFKENKERHFYDDGYGKEKAIVMCLNYPNSLDVSRGYTGHGIAIHATKLGGLMENASGGCIRMDPDDARNLYKQIEIGCKVYILD